MYIYILLLAFILGLALIAANLYPEIEKRESLILKGGMTFIWVILALKKYTVGSDIPGYRDHYNISASIPWLDFDYIYFENGYIFLMKLFSKLGIDFQVFMIAIYTFSCIVMYYFIKKYSKNVTLSLIIFICYQYFVFYISGVRQLLAMAICLCAYMFLDSDKYRLSIRIIGFCGLVYLANLFHNSAMIFIIVLFFKLVKFKKLYYLWYIPIFLFSFFLRTPVLKFLKIFYPLLHIDNDMVLQGNFIILLLFSMLAVIALLQYKNDGTILSRQRVEQIDEDLLFFMTNMIFTTVILQVLFSGNPILRGTLFLTLFFIPGIPNLLKCVENKIEILMTWILLFCFIYLFVVDTLLKNQLNLCPYLFFWQ